MFTQVEKCQKFNKNIHEMMKLLKNAGNGKHVVIEDIQIRLLALILLVMSHLPLVASFEPIHIQQRKSSYRNNNNNKNNEIRILSQQHQPRLSLITAWNNNNNNNELDEDNNELDVFLDTPFYNPDTILDDPSSSKVSKNIAQFIKNDYETAEIILSGLLLVLLVIISQELLRIQIYGLDNYIPFSKGVLPGNLF